MLDNIKKYFQKQQFEPGILGIFINPHFFMRRYIFEHLKTAAPAIKGKILDVGCGIKPYQTLFSNCSGYIGMEYDSSEQRKKSRADFFYDGNRFPFADESFDSVLLTEVLEHIFNPEEFISEVSRVLKKDGIILITTPFVWYEHSQPFDYGRYSSFGLKHLIQKHGFEIIKQEKLGNGISTIFQLVNGYLYKKISVVPYYKLKLILYAALISPWTISGIALSSIFRDGSELYLDNIVLARKVRAYGV